MKVYKIFNKVTGKYAHHSGWGRGIKMNYNDIASATRAVAHCGFNKENAEIHGFKLDHVTTRGNDKGGKWGKEIDLPTDMTQWNEGYEAGHVAGYKEALV